MSNIYKPRYKICFQTKNKVWIYKNSRLRHFYNIRAYKIVNKKWSYKKILSASNMKWTVTRRFIIPFNYKNTQNIYTYKNTLHLKQQLKSFYGKLKEYKLRNLFKNTWNKKQFFKRNVFISSLEQRLDMVLYRMRLLPTIYSCHQLINHQGILINNDLINIPGYKVNIGDIVSIPKKMWPIFYNLIFYKIKKRCFGSNTFYLRKGALIEDIEESLAFRKNYYKHNLGFIKKIEKNRKIFYKYFKYFKMKYEALNNSPNKNKEFLSFYKKVYFMLIPINGIVNSMKPKIKKLNYWNKPEYFAIYSLLILKHYAVAKSNIWVRSVLRKHFFFLIFNKKLKNILKNSQKNIIDDTNINLNEDCVILLTIVIYMNKYHNNLYQKQCYFLDEELEDFIYKNFKHSYKLNFNSNLWYLKPLPTVRGSRLLEMLDSVEERKELFDNKIFQHQWYTPSYLEIDYKTLRASFLYHPNNNELIYGFPCSFDRIISFYKEQAL